MVAALLAVALGAAACGGGAGPGPGRASASGRAHAPTGVTSGATSGVTSGATSGVTSTTGAAVPPAAPPLAAGQQGSRRSVPWSAVGAGWLLATWRTSPQPSSGAGTPPATLFLVDPQGGRYDLGPAPAAGVLTDWSGDGADALFLVPTTPSATGAGNEGAVVVDLRTGGTQEFSAGTGLAAHAVQFTEPQGTAVVVSGNQVRRFSLAGALQQTYPAAPGSTITGGPFAETPTGSELAVPAAGGIDVTSAGGSGLRFIGRPPGQVACAVDGMWQATAVLESCGATLWAQPLSGAGASRLATAPTGATLLDGWTVGATVVAEAGACGTTWLETGTPGGTLSPLPVPGVPAGGSVDPLGTQGTRLGVLLGPGCDAGTARQQGSTLAWFDPGTGALTPLLGARAGGGTVDAAVLYHGPLAGSGGQPPS